MYLFVEIIRLFQSPLIKYDKNIYDSSCNKPSLARTSELPDELGQVNYILSDKTGTLTKNNMVLEHISVQDKIYSIDEISKFFSFKYNIPLVANDIESKNRGNLECINSYKKIPPEFISDTDSKIKEESSSSSDSSSDKKNKNDGSSIYADEEKIVDFFRLVNICNSIVINFNKTKEEKHQLIYQVKYS
jgi:magnesium-transporting ATPase (P-type)